MGKISGLLDEEMPREKLIKLGVSSLTKIELLAIILRVGTKDKNVLELSREIIERFDINLVSRKMYDELLEFKGISEVKACQIVSVFELVRRLSCSSKEKLVIISNSKELYDYVVYDFLALNIERVMVVYVNTKNGIIKKEFAFQGSLSYSVIEPRDIIKRALSLDASGFFVVHNHPSGDVRPSEEDIKVTKTIKTICSKLNIRFLDHIIVGQNDFYSMFDDGCI